jgi:hypothetical protein
MITDMNGGGKIIFSMLSQGVEEHLSMPLRTEEDFSIMFGSLSRGEGWNARWSIWKGGFGIVF